ncbi:hypothetical protein EOD42_16210 [Rhodovarius crocodyli]|uniref:Uncharacterized protein n=1 Tax=Rhodovarius crocodyli TaxID=1979269 RepID=A0A437MDL4_9PROT|nr:hypothetical protein [Rhodovarius crocodyli]RVT95735.1 hypothetical protein EOD42_16210 [Rhodovarius crocodyli]
MTNLSMLRVLLPALLLASCATPGTRVSEEARRRIVGMEANSFMACAGIPQRSRTLSDGSEIMSYEQTNASTGGVNLSAPFVGGVGFRIGASGSYCHTVVRVRQNRVISLNYTGDNDDVAGQNGVCAPQVRGCLRWLEEQDQLAASPPASAAPAGGTSGTSPR